MWLEPNLMNFWSGVLKNAAGRRVSFRGDNHLWTSASVYDWTSCEWCRCYTHTKLEAQRETRWPQPLPLRSISCMLCSPCVLWLCCFFSSSSGSFLTSSDRLSTLVNVTKCLTEAHDSDLHVTGSSTTTLQWACFKQKQLQIMEHNETACCGQTIPKHSHHFPNSQPFPVGRSSQRIPEPETCERFFSAAANAVDDSFLLWSSV